MIHDAYDGMTHDDNKIIGVNCYFCCSYSEVVFHKSSVFLMKPGVYCRAKRQNKSEKITSLRIFTGKTTE